MWELVPREPGMNVLGCKFVYKKKRKPDGEVYRRKVRLVAKEFRQKEGIDFGATFSTTVAMQLSCSVHPLVVCCLPFVFVES